MTFKKEDIIKETLDSYMGEGKYPNPANAMVPNSSSQNSVRYGLKNIGRNVNWRQNHIYFLRNNISGNIKIGYTSDLEKRKQNIQTSCDGVLEYIITIRVSDELVARRIESELHKKFSASRLVGEWFAYTKEMSDLLGVLARVKEFPVFGKNTHVVKKKEVKGKQVKFWSCGHKKQDWQSACSKCKLASK